MWIGCLLQLLLLFFQEFFVLPCDDWILRLSINVLNVHELVQIRSSRLQKLLHLCLYGSQPFVGSGSWISQHLIHLIDLTGKRLDTLVQCGNLTCFELFAERDDNCTFFTILHGFCTISGYFAAIFQLDLLVLG